MCAAALQDGSTVLHLVAKSVMCDKASQLSMAKAFIAAGADPAALDGVSQLFAWVLDGSEGTGCFCGLYSELELPSLCLCHVVPVGQLIHLIPNACISCVELE